MQSYNTDAKDDMIDTRVLRDELLETEIRSGKYPFLEHMFGEAVGMDGFLSRIVETHTEIEAFMEESTDGELGKTIEALRSAIDKIIAERAYH
jgi:hypothetical protein